MIQKQKRSYISTRSYYDGLRKIAHENAHQQLPQVMINKRGTTILKNQIAFDGISFDTFERLYHWQSSGQRVVKWDWRDVRQTYKPHPKRFELSIWHRDYLCGASIGKPTRGGSKLRLDFIEAHPEGSPLEGLITDFVFGCAHVYARAIGAVQIRIMHPVNESVRNYYMNRGGFLYNSEHDFCYRDV